MHTRLERLEDGHDWAIPRRHRLVSAAQGLFSQPKTLYPSKTDAQIWSMEGNTILPGIDDYPKKIEVTYPADAQRLYDFATSVGINTLSIRAIQRDNGG